MAIQDSIIKQNNTLTSKEVLSKNIEEILKKYNTEQLSIRLNDDIKIYNEDQELDAAYRNMANPNGIGENSKSISISLLRNPSGTSFGGKKTRRRKKTRRNKKYRNI